MQIVRLEIQAFRGIPNDLVLDLSDEQGRPRSLILYGDNGTGKSSVVDALEFVLQARINRSHNIRRKSYPSAISYAGTQATSVEVTLSDDTRVERQIFVDGRARMSNAAPHPKFAIAPFVLRRADILRFLDTPDSQRQIIFMDYFQANSEHVWEASPVQRLQEVKYMRTETKNERRRLVSDLARKLDIPERRIPLVREEFDHFVSGFVFRGASQRRIERNKSEIDKEVLAYLDGIRETFGKISTFNAEINALEKSQKERIAKPILPPEILASVSATVVEAFAEISSTRFIKSISFKYGEMSGSSIEMLLRLSNGKTCSAHQVLSEANLDLLALLVFLAVAQEAANRGQERLLVLDDVFQSIDATIRVTCAQYVLRKFRNWQVILTVHDRLWQEQLRQLFRSSGHPFVEREIVRWSFQDGPVIRDARRDMDKPLLDALEQGESIAICSQAGLVLEAICDTLSWTLDVSVTRRRGDKYTLGDLWPPVYKALKKTSAQKEAADVETWQFLRNLVGAHYNEWAQGVSNEEARQFGESVIELLRSVRCTRCFRWVERISDKSWACRCGHTTLSMR